MTINALHVGAIDLESGAGTTTNSYGIKRSIGFWILCLDYEKRRWGIVHAETGNPGQVNPILAVLFTI